MESVVDYIKGTLLVTRYPFWSEPNVNELEEGDASERPTVDDNEVKQSVSSDTSTKPHHDSPKSTQRPATPIGEDREVVDGHLGDREGHKVGIHLLEILHDSDGSELRDPLTPHSDLTNTEGGESSGTCREEHVTQMHSGSSTDSDSSSLSSGPSSSQALSSRNRTGSIQRSVLGNEASVHSDDSSSEIDSIYSSPTLISDQTGELPVLTMNHKSADHCSDNLIICSDHLAEPSTDLALHAMTPSCGDHVEDSGLSSTGSVLDDTTMSCDNRAEGSWSSSSSSESEDIFVVEELSRIKLRKYLTKRARNSYFRNTASPNPDERPPSPSPSSRSQQEQENDMVLTPTDPEVMAPYEGDIVYGAKSFADDDPCTPASHQEPMVQDSESDTESQHSSEPLPVVHVLAAEVCVDGSNSHHSLQDPVPITSVMQNHVDDCESKHSLKEPESVIAVTHDYSEYGDDSESHQSLQGPEPVTSAMQHYSDDSESNHSLQGLESVTSAMQHCSDDSESNHSLQGPRPVTPAMPHYSDDSESNHTLEEPEPVTSGIQHYTDDSESHHSLEVPEPVTSEIQHCTDDSESNHSLEELEPVTSGIQHYTDDSESNHSLQGPEPVTSGIHHYTDDSQSQCSSLRSVRSEGTKQTRDLQSQSSYMMSSANDDELSLELDDYADEEDLAELFHSYTSSQQSSAVMESRRNSRVLSPFSDSHESVASVYSSAGEGHFGKVDAAGEVQFAVDYNYKLGILEIQVKQCKSLAAADEKRNRSDPYVKTYLLPDKTKSGKRKTRVKKHTLNPTFEETLRYSITKGELEARSLWVSVWHGDRFGRNAFLGEVSLPMDRHNFNDTSPYWHPLQNRKSQEASLLTYKGDLILYLKHVPSESIPDRRSHRVSSRGELLILVKEAHNLTAVRANGFSNSFCKCYLLPDRSKDGKQKTAVVKKNCSPRWNHFFLYENLTMKDLKERCLEITIWDHDRWTSNDFLGGVRLGLGTGRSRGRDVDWMDSRGEEISLWQSMLDCPDTWIEANITLRQNMDKRSSTA